MNQTMNMLLHLPATQIVQHLPQTFASMTAHQLFKLAQLSNLPREEMAKRSLPEAAIKQIIDHKPFLSSYIQQYSAAARRLQVQLQQQQPQQQQNLQQLMQSQQQQQQPPQAQPQVVPASTEQSSSMGSQVQGTNALQYALTMQQVNGMVSGPLPAPMMQIMQDAATKPEMLQQAVRRLGQLKEMARTTLADPAQKIVPDNERESFRNIFREQLRTHAEVEKVLPLFILYVKEEHSLQTILKMVCLFLL